MQLAGREEKTITILFYIHLCAASVFQKHQYPFLCESNLSTMKRFIISIFLFLFCHSILTAQKQQRILVPYKKGAITGLSDTLGNVIVKLKFDKVIDFNYYYDNKNRKTTSLFYVVHNGKKLIVDELNKVSPVNYKVYDSIWLTDFSREHLNVEKGGKNGVLFKNKILIPCKYDNIASIDNNSFEVEIDTKKGIINSAGKLIVPVVYDLIYYSTEGDLMKYEGQYIDETEKNINKTYYDGIIQTNSFANLPAAVVTKSVGVVSEKETVPDLERMKNDYDSFKTIPNYAPFMYVYKNVSTGIYNSRTGLEIINTYYDEARCVISNRDNSRAIFKVKKIIITDCLIKAERCFYHRTLMKLK